MIDAHFADSLATGLMFLLNGAGAVLIAMPGRWKMAAWAAWALMIICLGAMMEGVDAAVPWRAFVETCFAVWALLFAVAFIRAARRTGAGNGRVESLWPTAHSELNESDAKQGTIVN